MAVVVNTNIVPEGLIYSLDAANFKSYPGSGTTFNGLFSSTGGTLVNGTGYTSDGGGSFVFDGTNDYLITSSNVSPLGANPRTICIWFYMSTAQRKNLYGYGQPGSGQIFDIITWDSDALNRIIGHYWGGGYDTIGSLPSRNTLNIPGWNFLVHTYNGSTVSLYTNTVFSNSTNLGLNTFSGSLTVAKGTYFPYDYFTGKVSTLQIFNRVLSTLEMNKIYNATRDRYGV